MYENLIEALRLCAKYGEVLHNTNTGARSSGCRL